MWCPFILFHAIRVNHNQSEAAANTFVAVQCYSYERLESVNGHTTLQHQGRTLVSGDESLTKSRFSFLKKEPNKYIFGTLEFCYHNLQGFICFYIVLQVCYLLSE